MRIFCKAGQQVRAKAQDSAHLDKDRMPLLGAPSLADKQARAFRKCSRMTVQQNQDNSLCCVYYISQGLGRSDY